MSGFKAALVLTAMRLFARLPLNVGRYCGSLLALLCWMSKDRNTRVSCENIRLCFPDLSESARRDLAKKSMLETGKLAGELSHVWCRNNTWLRKQIHAIYGEELIQAAVKQGKGVIVLSPHIGNWEVFGSVLTDYAPMSVLYQPPKMLWFEPLIKRFREKHGYSTLPTTPKGVAGLLNRLKAGEMAGVLPDQCPSEPGGEFSEFFGVPAFTMTLIHKLTKKTGCKVIAGFALRTSEGFTLHFIEPPKEIYCDDQSQSVRALNLTVETCVNHCVEQYQWEYKRFKKRLPDGTRFYKNC